MNVPNFFTIYQKYDWKPVLLILSICLAASLALPAMAVTGFVFYYEAYGLVYPNVDVAGIDLGGMTKEQAMTTLNEAWGPDRRLLVQFDHQVWQDTALAFGIWLDAEATTEEAYRVGRGTDVFLEGMRVLFNQDISIQPHVNIQLDLAGKRLEDVAFLVDDSGKGNRFRFVDSQWKVVSGSEAYSFDLHQTLLNMATRPDLVLLTGILPLSMNEAEEVLKPSQEEREALEILNSDLSLRAYDPIEDEFYERNFSPEETARWVKIQNQQGEPDIQVNWEVFQSDLQIWLDALPHSYTIDSVKNSEKFIERWKNGKSITVVLRHAPTTYLVQSGDTLLSIASKTEIPYWRILAENPGLSEYNLSTGMELTIPSKNDLLPLPVVIGKRIVIRIPEQRMRVYEDGELLEEYVISTGISRSPTAAGVFQVQTHELNAYASIWDLYMPHFLGIYEAAPGFMNGIHGLPMLSSGQRLWANILGSPASYGCIILDLEDAEYLYNWAEDGVVVEIQD